MKIKKFNENNDDIYTLKGKLYNNLHKIYLIDKKNDGKLAGDLQIPEDDLRNILEKSEEFISDLEEFFNKI